MSSIGGCCSGLEFPLDMYPTFLDEVTVFSNLEADYAQARDGIVLNDTHGKPVVVDIFNETMRNSQISNRNFTAIGPSGSGKSVSANKLISGLVQTDEYFNFILDDGESYEMLHYLMGEKSGYMRMTPTGVIVQPVSDSVRRSEKRFGKTIGSGTRNANKPDTPVMGSKQWTRIKRRSRQNCIYQKAIVRFLLSPL